MQKFTQAGEALNDMIWEVLFLFFRLRSATEPSTLGSYRASGAWSLMRSVRLKGPQSVAQIARARPVARQGVQRLANELEAQGLVRFIENPTHRRSQLVQLTPKGEKFLDRLDQTAVPWANSLAKGLNARELHNAVRVLREFGAILNRSMRHRAGELVDAATIARASRTAKGGSDSSGHSHGYGRVKSPNG